APGAERLERAAVGLRAGDRAVEEPVDGRLGPCPHRVREHGARPRKVAPAHLVDRHARVPTSSLFLSPIHASAPCSEPARAKAGPGEDLRIGATGRAVAWTAPGQTGYSSRRHHHFETEAGRTDMAVTVGFIGVGNMGNPMAGNVLKAGFPMTVYDK